MSVQFMAKGDLDRSVLSLRRGYAAVNVCVIL